MSTRKLLIIPILAIGLGQMANAQTVEGSSDTRLRSQIESGDSRIVGTANGSFEAEGRMRAENRTEADGRGQAESGDVDRALLPSGDASAEGSMNVRDEVGATVDATPEAAFDATAAATIESEIGAALEGEIDAMLEADLSEQLDATVAAEIEREVQESVAAEVESTITGAIGL